MIILLKKRHVAGAVLFACFLFAMGAVLWQGSPSFAAAFSAQETSPVTVVLDPGHGGEDGGAVSPDGVVESQLNLEISLRLRDLLCFTGTSVVMTRSEDVSICDPGLATVRERKVSDLKNRVALVNATPEAVLLSIHQNSLPSSTVTHGAQVFWNQAAEPLAEAVQTALNETVNQGNEKHAKPIGNTIYLTKNITAPGLIVECGFLSNGAETAKLQEPSYQRILATAIAAGFLNCDGASLEGT